MIKKRNNVRPFELVLGFIILYSIMPFVAQMVSDLLTTYAYMVILLGAVVYTMTIRGTESLAESVLLLIPFIMWMVLEFLTKDQSLLLWGYSSMAMLAPLLFGMLLMKETGGKAIRFLAFAVAIAVVVTAITTILGSIIYPDAARYLATVAETDDPKLRLFNRINLGGYNFIYTAILLYPAVIFAFKQKKLRLIWAVLLSILMLSLALNSGYTTAFLLWIATTSMFFFPRNLKKRWVLVLLIATIVGIVIFFSFFSSGIKSLSKMVDNEDISYRLEALSGGSEGIEASDDNRILFYRASMEAFLNSPFFGAMISGGYVGGGHSFILDFLAYYGLIGAVLLIVMYRIIYVNFYKPFEHLPGYGYIFWMFLQALVLSTINTGMWINVLSWFVPILVSAILQMRVKEFKLQRDLKKAAEERRIRVK